MELDQKEYFGGEIVYSSRKNNLQNLKIKKRSPKENYNVALLDLEKRKIKDMS